MFSLICALNKRLSKQSWGWRFETLSRSLWRIVMNAKISSNQYRKSHCGVRRSDHNWSTMSILWSFRRDTLQNVVKWTGFSPPTLCFLNTTNLNMYLYRMCWMKSEYMEIWVLHRMCEVWLFSHCLRKLQLLSSAIACLLHFVQSKDVSSEHYSDVIMDAMPSQITGVSIVCSTDGSGADQRKHQSSASLAFMQGIHRSPVNSLHKWPVSRKMFPFYDVIMGCSYSLQSPQLGTHEGSFTNK